MKDYISEECLEEQGFKCVRMKGDMKTYVQEKRKRVCLLNGKPVYKWVFVCELDVKRGVIVRQVGECSVYDVGSMSRQRSV